MSINKPTYIQYFIKLRGEVFNSRSVHNSSQDRNECEKVRLGAPQNLPQRPQLRTALSVQHWIRISQNWINSTLYAAGLVGEPRNIHMLPFIYWRKPT